MIVSATPPAPVAFPVSPRELGTQLNEIAMDLTRLDVKLEENQRNGRYPTNGYPEWFRGLADRIDSARMGVAQLAPQRDDLVHRLGQEALDLGEYAGQTRVMQNHQLTFARGWDTLVDGTIRTVQEAAGFVSSIPDSPVPPTYPGGGPVPPTQPPFPGSPSQVTSDAARAAELVQRSIDTIRTVPVSDRGDASTKDARIAAYNLNMDAQKLLEQHFDTAAPAEVSQLRQADAFLEDANWQLAKKPSPDGRFNGVDIPGALRDSQAALNALQQLAAATPTA